MKNNMHIILLFMCLTVTAIYPMKRMRSTDEFSDEMKHTRNAADEFSSEWPSDLLLDTNYISSKLESTSYVPSDLERTSIENALLDLLWTTPVESVSAAKKNNMIKSFPVPSLIKATTLLKIERPRNFKCTFEGCEKSFVNSSNLSAHMRIHTGERPYLCNQCGETFIQQGHLSVHKNKHERKKPFKCTFEGCFSRFTYKDSLKAHIMNHKGERPYLCTICDKTFIQKTHLTSHMRNRHK